MPSKGGSYEKKLPEWILDSSKEFRRGLMESLWKGDGCYWKKKGYNGYTFELQTVSKSLGHQIFNLLIAEGFNPTLRSQNRQSVVWIIRINNHQDFGKFIDIEQVNLPHCNGKGRV